LRPGGRFCFSVEAGDGADYVLRPSNRYAHTPDYLQRLAAATGFTVLASQAIEARQENGAPIAARTAAMQIDHIFIRVQPGGRGRGAA
jgi:predicted TPR repeat methyltransferase